MQSWLLQTKRKLNQGEEDKNSYSNKMTKKIGTLTTVIMWIVGLLVTLAIAFGLIGKTLTVPFIPVVVTIIAGWIIVILAIIGIIVRLSEL